MRGAVVTPIFALGLTPKENSVCASGILRMKTLDMSPGTTYHSATKLPSAIWTTVEANVAIICACLPMIHTTLSAHFPNFFPTFRSGCGKWVGTRVPTPVREKKEKKQKEKRKPLKKTTLQAELDESDQEDDSDSNRV